MSAVVEKQIKPYYKTGRFTLFCGDCRSVLPTLETESVDSIVTDPPYHLTQMSRAGSPRNNDPETPYGRTRIGERGFMGKTWDGGDIAHDVDMWIECLRVLKPGGHLLAFGGSRTYHRLACAIEDAGFEIRDDIDFWYDANPIFAAFYDSLTPEQQAQLHQCAGASHLSWIYGSGFPKSLDVSKAIDAAAGAVRQRLGVVDSRNRDGANRQVVQSKSQGYGFTQKGGLELSAASSDAAQQWNGWGTALKPAHEPIVLARKPLIGTVAENVLRHNTGALNIDGCRIEFSGNGDGEWNSTPGRGTAGQPDKGTTGIYGYFGGEAEPKDNVRYESTGRWPANVIHDGSDEVLALFPETSSGALSGPQNDNRSDGNRNGWGLSGWDGDTRYGSNSGSAARFFYCAKADQQDRNEGLETLEPRRKVEVYGNGLNGATRFDPKLHTPEGVAARPLTRNHHPTVKPTDLMRYLCRLITPPNGLVLDPFCGSGSTGKAAMMEGLRFIGIELEPEYVELAQLRIASVKQQLLTFETADARH